MWIPSPRRPGHSKHLCRPSAAASYGPSRRGVSAGCSSGVPAGGALKAAVRAATGTEPQDEEPWERVSFPVPPEVRPVVEEALELAGRVIGPTTPKWERIEAICQEYLGAHVLPEGAAKAAVLRAPIETGRLEVLKQALEEQTGQWAFLDRVGPVIA